jgi:hypothetical protein
MMGKIVARDNAEKLISYVVYSPPKPVDERTGVEKDRDLRADLEKFPPWTADKEEIFRLKNEDRALQESFYGKGFESRLWEVCVWLS